MQKNQFHYWLKKLSFIAKIVTLATVNFLLNPIVVSGQNLPTPPLPEELQRTQPQPLSPLPEIIPQSPNPPSFLPLSPEAIPGKILVTGKILVKRFEILGNTVFNPEEITRLTQPYTLRRISFVELLEVPQKITQLYVDNGYITSGAVILPQTIEDRVVKIQIIEGKLEDIQISGLKRLNPNYIRRRLEIATKAPLNQNKLLNALQVLQLDPLIANISAELSAGIEPNTSLLQIEVEEADAFSVALNFDNNRVPTVGTFRRQIALNHNNLFGYGDRFIVSYVNTDGSDALDNLNYEFPINARNGKIRLAHNRTSSKIIQEPFDRLNIKNRTRRYEIGSSQPLFQSLNQEMIVGITLSQETTITRFGDDLPFPNTGNATVENDQTKVTVLRLFQNFTMRDQRQVLGLRSQLNFGLDALDSTIDPILPDSRFVSWQGQAEYFRLLSSSTSFYVRSDLQLANDHLVSLEKFTLGGGLSVRGYSQNALIGDNGFFISTEIRQKIASIEKSQATFELVPFVDLGKVWNTQSRIPQPKTTLLSVGIGFRASVGDNLLARIDWGIPLVELDSLGDSLQENGIYFSLQTRF
ncbi:MAG: ShlB/FhaC/HecB family hemolysin secretion/activation protein [Xenococcaceae cyanobacterium MO_188.B19]|nr:ShlB/FhaC/HecB family hemolysin secretion/activation protein [Xenococcaceae cyanobacterium MO_188.B19]